MVANFFLNVFGSKSVDQFVDRIVTFAKPGGHVAIGDWSRPKKGYNPAKKFVVNGNWYVGSTFFKVLGTGNTLHPIHDYPELFTSRGMSIAERKYFRLLRVKTYECLIMHKPKGVVGDGSGSDSENEGRTQ